MRKTFATAFKLIALSAIALATADAKALPLVWRADWPGSKPVETLVHRGTDIELQPQFYVNREPVNSTNWIFTTFVQTNNQATGEWFGPLPGAAFSHTNDIGAAFYNVMVRAEMPGGGINYTAFARLSMLDSPGFTPGELHLPVAVLDFAQVEVRNAEMIVPDISSSFLVAAASYTDGATNALGQAMATADAALSAATATNTDAIATINSKIPRAASQSNQLADKEWIDDEIDTYAAYYITYTAAGAAFPTRAALLNATVVYSGGAARTPTRNDYAVVLADEAHGGAEWRYIYTVADGATTGQWEAQYPIETNDYEALSNKPQINGHTMTGNQTGAVLGLIDQSGGDMILPYDDDVKSYFGIRDSDHSDYSIKFYSQDDDDYYIIELGHTDMEFTDKANLYVYSGNMLFWDILKGGRRESFKEIYEDLPKFSDISAAALAATNYTDAAISPTSPAFSNAVLSVGLGIDTNTVAVINALVEQGEELPIGGATTVGALLLALAAAIAALKRDKADASALPYAISESTPLTVTSGAAVTTLADRTHNVRTVAAPGSGNTTAIIAMLPAIVPGKSRDMFLNIKVGTQAGDAGDISLLIVEPSGENVQIDIGSVEDIGVGENEIMISERALPTTSGNTTITHWLVTVRHEDFAS